MNVGMNFEISGAVMDIQLGNLFFLGEIHPLVIIITVSSSNHLLLILALSNGEEASIR
jgi:hypothetical protein